MGFLSAAFRVTVCMNANDVPARIFLQCKQACITFPPSNINGYDTEIRSALLLANSDVEHY